MSTQGCVVVTGAARGIGAAIAAAFHQAGKPVALLDVDRTALKERVEQLQSANPDGPDLASWSCDVGDRAGVKQVAEDVVRTWGKVDVLVNNAGVARAVPFMELGDADWQQVMATNLYGTFVCSQEFGRFMADQGRGVIICIGSTNGMRGQERLAPYNASKAGVISLVQTMAVELAPFGVRAVAVCPGAINTQLEKDEGFGDEYLARMIEEKVPLRRWGRPDEIGSLCVFVASDAAAYITGQTIVADGGLICRQ